ncbi:MAG: hypothetical protein AAF360_12965 [Pseudomonadota bacterium]
MSPDGTNPDAPRRASASKRRVRRRRVLYFHGFDPAPSDRYRRMIGRAGANWGDHAPQMTPVGPVTDISEGWRVVASENGGAVETVFEVLRYEDIVRQWRDRPLMTRLRTGLSAWCRFAFGGGLARAYGLARGPAGLIFYPVAMLAMFILFGLLFGRLAGEAAEAYGAPGWSSQLGRVLGAIGGVWLSVRWERSLFVHLMLALFDFLIRVAEDKPPAGRLEMRIDAFADRIAACVDAAGDAEVDEILVVGHSLGGLVAVRALARAMERDVDLTGGRAELSLLTLGSVAGFVACRGGAGADAYGEDVARIASSQDLFWLDVSTPRDWFSFGLVDPLMMVDAPLTEARSPLVISARFGRFRPDPEDKRTKFRAMGVHMKYLAAPDHRGGFDFFGVAAGGQTLSDRHKGRRSSPKARMRIE